MPPITVSIIGCQTQPLFYKCYILPIALKHERYAHADKIHSGNGRFFTLPFACYSSPSHERPQSHLKKWSLKRGLPYLVGNQELKPLVSVPDYPPNKANPFWETVFWGDFLLSPIRGTTVHGAAYAVMVISIELILQTGLISLWKFNQEFKHIISIELQQRPQ